MHGDHAACEVDLFELGARRPLEAGGDPDAPELAADEAFAQAREVGVALLAAGAQIVALEVARSRFANRPRQVIVAVDEGDSGEQRSSVGERIVIGGGGDRSCRHDGSQRQGQAAERCGRDLRSQSQLHSSISTRWISIMPVLSLVGRKVEGGGACGGALEFGRVRRVGRTGAAGCRGSGRGCRR